MKIATLARPVGVPDRRALALADDDEAARAAVGTFLDHLGYDPVDAGPLAVSPSMTYGGRPEAGSMDKRQDPYLGFRDLIHEAIPLHGE